MTGKPLSIRVAAMFGGFSLDVDEKLGPSGCTAVFGPSGGGKTTLLRLIAGFARPRAGRIAFGDDVWFDAAAHRETPAHRRPVGFLFQDARLFEHLSVEGNIGYADARSARAASAYGVDDVIDALDLEPLLDRRPQTLSGGERQRAALARTLMTRPKLLLLDEPLAALDRSRKSDILPYLEDLPRRFGLRTIYVSHDVDEVARLADDILVLDAGRVVLRGGAAHVIESLGAGGGDYETSALIEGAVARHDVEHRLTYALIDGVEIAIPLVDRLAPGTAVRLRVRARDVALATERPQRISIRNVLPGVVADITETGDAPSVIVAVALGGARVLASVTRAAVADLDLAPGAPVFALIKSASFEGRV